MNIKDYVLLLLIAVLVIKALIHIFKKGSCGCACKGCTVCQKKCTKKENLN